MKTIFSSRRDHYLAKFSIFLITVALIAGMVGCTEPSENLDIEDWYDLNKVREYKYRSGHHKLMNDLDSTTDGYEELASPTANGGKGWQPIGDSITPFKGSLDGQGYTIEDLVIHRPGESDVGLFGSIAERAVIENVEVANITVTGGWGVGALVGKNKFEGTVSNCSSSGSVSGNMYVGGLVGENYGTVSDGSRFSSGTVTSEKGSYIGGLVGKNNGGNVSDSYSIGSVRGNDNVGGLVGENYAGNVSDSQSTGSVRGNDNVGGLVGFNNGIVSTVNNSSSSSEVTGSNEHVGGLVGWNDGTVSNSYSTGSVTSEEGSYIGGLVGKNNGGNVSDSYSTGSVTGESYVGGLVGENYAGNVSNSYSTGNVTGEDGVGGLVGRNYDGSVSNSHYNYNETLINGENIITIGALFDKDFKNFEECLANDKCLDINGRLSEKNGYYEVNNVTDFKQLLVFGQDSLKFRLNTDLDLTTEPNFYIPYFAGTFEGNGHNISNLSFNFTFVYNIGLFGYLARGGRVTQVDVEDVDITGASYVGGLVGDNNGIVSNSYSSGSVTGDNYVGGLVGHNYRQGKVRNSYSNGIVSGTWGTGGLVGRNQGTVEKSHSTGSVSGGVLFILGDVVGGLVGFNEYIVRESYSTGSVTGDNYVGGLVGSNKYIVRESYSTSSVTGDNYVGGLVGANYYEVSDSYSTGSVTSEEGSYIGGLVGSNGGPGTVSDSYSTGSVSGNLHVGGLVGRNYGNVADSFWDEENSGMTDGVGTGDDTGITSKSEQEMKDIETYRATGWDIVKIEDYVDQTWYIDDGKDYPRLGWQKQ